MGTAKQKSAGRKAAATKRRNKQEALKLQILADRGQEQMRHLDIAKLAKKSSSTKEPEAIFEVATSHEAKVIAKEVCDIIAGICFRITKCPDTTGMRPAAEQQMAENVDHVLKEVHEQSERRLAVKDALIKSHAIAAKELFDALKLINAFLTSGAPEGPKAEAEIEACYKAVQALRKKGYDL